MDASKCKIRLRPDWTKTADSAIMAPNDLTASIHTAALTSLQVDLDQLQARQQLQSCVAAFSGVR